MDQPEMYTLAVRRTFIARHYLIGGDWGPENFPNSHQYLLELQLEGSQLDTHGYLCDIVEIEKMLDETIDRYSEKMLNELKDFEGLNPSLEHFVRILGVSLSDRITAENILGIRVVLWENPTAWASYRISR